MHLVLYMYCTCIVVLVTSGVTRCTIAENATESALNGEASFMFSLFVSDFNNLKVSLITLTNRAYSVNNML